MKKLSFIAIAAAAIAFAGCQLEREIDSPRNLGDSTVIATLGNSTRSYLEAGEEGEATTYNVFWSAPDQILIAFAGGEPALYTSTNAEPAQTAAFRGTFPKGEGDLYGIYPAEDGNEVDADGIISIKFHAEQTAVAGSYDPQASPAVAVSESKDLSFMNICGLLELKVGWDDVSKITLDGAMSKTLIPGGVLSVSMDEEPVLEDWSEDLDGISLLPPSGESVFSQEETYYMAVPPCSFPGGASFIVERAEGEETIIIEGSVSVERAKVHEVPVLYVEPIVLVESIEPEADAMEIEFESEPFSIEITVGPEDADDKSVSWESSNPDVVTVDEDGLITVVGSGEATITVTANDGSEVSATIEITVLLPKNRLSYDGGETWYPLNSAGLCVSPDRGYNMVFSSDAEADFEHLYAEPPGDWFGLDIAISKIGTEWELPQDLYDGIWYCYMSWKGLDGDVMSNSVKSGSLCVDIPSDYSTIDIEADIEYDGDHVIVIYSGPASFVSDEVYFDYMYTDAAAPSVEEIEECIAGPYELYSVSNWWEDYEATDELTIEAQPHNSAGVVLISGTFAEIGPVEIYANVAKVSEGIFKLYIPYGISIFEGIVPWYDENNEALVKLYWSYEDEEGYLYYTYSEIVIDISGDHELSLNVAYDYLMLLDSNKYDVVDLLYGDSIEFTYLGSSPSPAPALFKAPRAPRMEQGKGMLKMPESEPIKPGKNENPQLNHIRNAR